MRKTFRRFPTGSCSRISGSAGIFQKMSVRINLTGPSTISIFSIPRANGPSSMQRRRARTHDSSLTSLGRRTSVDSLVSVETFLGDFVQSIPFYPLWAYCLEAHVTCRHLQTSRLCV
ncbi:hypothetical protein RvY_00907-2 [Ramazzottius varieornatus]|uniref:Uncharacterized protein n=1 Tax=Ramazzottius varieornatus TaxID=947166 RepID=A0A1D1UKJ6_RAMVA|nr:hypothetical protein RvY_00907-2 [Ramazzottius varieornatus]